MANISNSNNNSLVNGTSSADSIVNYGDYVTISALAGNDSISNDGSNSMINSGAGNDSVHNYGVNVLIQGGAGEDLISLASYSQSNLIAYSAGDGNDSIIGFNEDDTLSIAGGYSTTKSGNDVIITVGDGKITLVGAASLSALNIDGEEQTASDTLILTNDDAAKITLSAQIVTADATARTKAIRITGNALDNSILGGSGKDTLYGKNGDDYLAGGKGNDKLYGQSGDDTLWGGLGNDTLYGGNGADKFLYEDGDGKDVISGFDNNDMLLITGAFTASYDKVADTIAFKVGSGSITLKDFTATTFNVNGFNYRVKGNKLVK